MMMGYGGNGQMQRYGRGNSGLSALAQTNGPLQSLDSDGFAAEQEWEQIMGCLGPPRPCPQDNRLQIRYCSLTGTDLYCGTGASPTPDQVGASKSQDWMERCGDGDWTWFTRGDTSKAGLEFLQFHPVS